MHFLVTQEIMLGHFMSAKGIEVNKSKVEAISNLPTPKIVILGHASFYRHFIKDLSALARHLTNLLAKDVLFV